MGNIVGQLTTFGYILSGKIENSTDKTTNHQMLCITEKRTKKSNIFDFNPHLNSNRNRWGVC